MEKAKLSKNSQKETGEKPNSQEKTDVVHEASVLRGTYLPPFGKCGKFQAFSRKPDVKEEIMILLCILKKALKVIFCHGQKKSCATAALAIGKYYMQMEKSLDDFKKNFIRIYYGENNICCYCKLLNNLMDTRCGFINETNRVYVYNAKADIINCAIATFRTLENRLYTIMSRVNEMGFCEQSCQTEVKNGFLGTCGTINIEEDKCDMIKAIENVACCGSPKEKSICVIPSKNSKCEPERKLLCLKPEVYSEGINAEKPGPSSSPFNMTLDYVKYKTDYDSSSDDESDYYVETLPSGYFKSKIVSKNGTITLSVKCVSHDEDLCLLNPNETGYIEQIKKIAEDMVPIFNKSKAWLNNCKEYCQQILDKRLK